MPFNRLRLAAVVIGAGSIVLAASGCQEPAGEGSARAAGPGAAPVARVKVVAPRLATIRLVSEEPGQVEAAETTAIHARIAGYVESLAVDIGAQVEKGQVLAELSVPELEADRKEKRAALRQAEAQRDQSRAAVTVAEATVASASAKVEVVQSGIERAEADVARWASELARVEQLFRERALTGSLRDETRSKLRAAEAGRDEVKAQVRSAQAALAEAKAQLDQARADLEAAESRIEVARFAAQHAEAMAGYARIVAPFDGVVTYRGVDRGHLTAPGTTGTPLFRLDRSDIVTVAVGVPEADAPRVNPGDAAQIRLQTLGGTTVEGRVTRVSWSLDPETRTLRAEIDLPNPDGLLRPGLYAYVTIIADEHENALTVPSSAVVRDGADTFCVILEDGRARRRPVTVGLSDGQRTEIVTGLAEQDQVVEANAASLADGQPIEPAPAEPARPKS
jgi:HlyD family secretion protein